MAAVSKEELQVTTQKEFDKLGKLIDTIDVKTALRKDDEDTSIKDVVAHRAHWIGLFLGGMKMALTEGPFTFRHRVTSGTISRGTTQTSECSRPA